MAWAERRILMSMWGEHRLEEDARIKKIDNNIDGYFKMQSFKDNTKDHLGRDYIPPAKPRLQEIAKETPTVAEPEPPEPEELFTEEEVDDLQA